MVGNQYLSNVIADPLGLCVVDEERRLLTSRAEPGKLYVNPYVSFQLADAAAMAQPGLRSATVPIGQGSAPLVSNLATSTFGDVLPSVLRFYPGRNELYVVDSASQGLTRYTLNPFAREN